MAHNCHTYFHSYGYNQNYQEAVNYCQTNGGKVLEPTEATNDPVSKWANNKFSGYSTPQGTAVVWREKNFQAFCLLQIFSPGIRARNMCKIFSLVPSKEKKTVAREKCQIVKCQMSSFDITVNLIIQKLKIKHFVCLSF